MGPDFMILVFWMLSFKPAFSLSYFTFIKRLFGSSSLSPIGVVLSAYLRLLIFLPAIFIPACNSPSLAFCMMYSAYKLNKQGYSVQSWCTPFPILNQCVVLCCSSSNCCFLSCIHVSQEADKTEWYFHLFRKFPQFVVIHIIKGFSIVNEAEVVFLELSCFFYDPTDVGNLTSGSSAFSKSRKCILYICKFSIYVLLKPSWKDIEHDLASMWNEDNCEVVWTFFGIAILWDWNENWHFPVLWPLLSFPHLLALSVSLEQQHLLGFELAQLEFQHLH